MVEPIKNYFPSANKRHIPNTRRITEPLQMVKHSLIFCQSVIIYYAAKRANRTQTARTE